MSERKKAETLVNEFGEYCRELVRFHIPDYKFSWNQNKDRFGVCRYGKKTVELSILNFLLNPHTGNDTIRHEIAHALAKEIGGKHHDYIWQKEAMRMGAEPTRCVTGKLQLYYKYELFCGGCGKTWGRNKMTSKTYWCHCGTKLGFRRRENNHNIVIPTMEELNLPAVDAIFPVIFAEPEKPKKETLATTLTNLGIRL